ncbi:tRNA (adenosine(37)-N6)-threonylcarbamoyltransferase complex dimerization subunit type 1 TsaB [candidate division KSB1 bacterium]|nr:tRNA (adenosine(37)-N6)-threonylcarbamoyltransferase complex dimerization subunit type 1 TsaB [candidate division KSB1 bacterium]
MGFRTLALETSGECCGVCLAEGKNILVEHCIRGRHLQSRLLAVMVSGVVGEAGLSLTDLSGIAISAGPGSFTGLRVGMGYAKGLAYGLELPLVAVPTLTVLASQLPFTRFPICPLLDAGRGLVYGGLYRWKGSSLIQEDRFRPVTPGALMEGIKEKTIFMGDGAFRFREDLEGGLKEQALFVPSSLNYPRPSTVAVLGGGKLHTGEGRDIDRLEPLYMLDFPAPVKSVE